MRKTYETPKSPVCACRPDSNTTYNTNEVNQLLSTLAPDRTFLYDDGA